MFYFILKWSDTISGVDICLCVQYVGITVWNDLNSNEYVLMLSKCVILFANS